MIKELARLVNEAINDGFRYAGTVQDDDVINDKADPDYGKTIRTINITLVKGVKDGIQD